MILPFNPISVTDQTLTLIQQAIKKCLDQFTGNRLLGGTLAQVNFTAIDQDVNVPHGFGTTNVGWLVGTQNLPGTVFRSPSKQNAGFLTLQCESTRTISKTNPLTCQVYIFPGVQ